MAQRPSPVPEARAGGLPAPSRDVGPPGPNKRGKGHLADRRSKKGCTAGKAALKGSPPCENASRAEPWLRGHAVARFSPTSSFGF